MNKVIAAIIAILILETVAVFNHIDGALFGIAITAIAGLGGYTVGKITKPK